MGFRKIKDGMIIHCISETEVTALLEHLSSLGYVWDDGRSLQQTSTGWHYHREDTCYRIKEECKRVHLTSTEGQRSGTVVYFYDLILPEGCNDWELAAEVVRMDKHETDKFNHMFIGHGAEYVLSNYSPAQVREIMTKYYTQHKVKIGDIVTVGSTEREFLVTKTEDGVIDGIDRHGGTRSCSIEEVTPTGKSADPMKWMLDVFQTRPIEAF